MDPVLRLIDANLNRAREGLRVIEDYARFVRDDRAIGEALRSIRNRLTSATRDVATRAIAHRDAANDVGTTYANADALPRGELRDVAIANGKRVGEALRAVEEYLKLIDVVAAREVEGCRYAFYDVERCVATTFRDDRFARVRLYVLITESQCRGRDWFEVARQALAGGADAIQLREKSMDAGELLARARRLVGLCREHHAILLVNDRPDVALLSGADGVHVGQGDLSARHARAIVGADKIVGVSTHEIAHARQARLDGADYVGVGPLFKSATKPRDFVSGLDYARSVAGEISTPAVGIAGITLDNLDDVLSAGLTRVAVTSAVIGAPDVAGAARSFKARLA